MSYNDYKCRVQTFGKFWKALRTFLNCTKRTHLSWVNLNVFAYF